MNENGGVGKGVRVVAGGMGDGLGDGGTAVRVIGRQVRGTDGGEHSFANLHISVFHVTILSLSRERR